MEGKDLNSPAPIVNNSWMEGGGGDGECVGLALIFLNKIVFSPPSSFYFIFSAHEKEGEIPRL